MPAASTRSYFTSIGVGVVATIVVAVFSLRSALQHRATEGSGSSGDGAPVGVERGPDRAPPGVAAIAVWIEKADGSRDAVEPTVTASLHPEERVRIGYQPAARRWVTVFSIDERGRVSSLYPKTGRSLGAVKRAEMSHLPDAIGLPGEGRERLFVSLTDLPLDAVTVVAAARAALQRAAGDPARIARVDLPGDQLSRLFVHVEPF